MQVAVSVYRHYLIAVADLETCLRRFTRLQSLALIALLCLKSDSLDVVFFNHWMLCSPDLYRDNVALDFNTAM